MKIKNFTPIGPCTYCGTQTTGEYSVHEFNFCVGNEVPLCNVCANDDEITLRKIWSKNDRKMLAALREVHNG